MFIILSSRLTSEKTHDSPELQTMLNRLKKYEVDLSSIFNADKDYDGERNFKSLVGIYVFPNIEQRTNAKKGKNRKKAAKIFNASIYHYRGLIEAIFGAKKINIISFIAESD